MNYYCNMDPSMDINKITQRDLDKCTIEIINYVKSYLIH